MEDQSSQEKTMRPQIQEKTMRPQVQEKTMRPQVQEKTMRPQVQEKTQRPQAQEKTMRPEERKSEIAKIVSAEIEEFVLNRVKYSVVKIISSGTGEAQIYLVENNGNQYALKLYYAGLIPPPNHSIMELVRQVGGTGLLVDTLQHGTWENPSTQEVRDYELMPYYAGGSLDQLNLEGNEKLLCEIALQCAVSIDFLHRKRIIHRDIKPANFFFKDKNRKIEDLALADFGIAIEANEEGKVEVEYQLRTKIYAAPEYYFSIDGKIQLGYKSDFYSLGMMLLTLWSGESIFSISEYELINLKRNGNLPYPKNVSDRTLQLFKALTHTDPNVRAGLPELIRWSKGEDIIDIKKEVSEDFKIIFNQHNKLIATSPEELGLFMFEDQELSIKYLYSGKIAEWLTANKRPELAVEIEYIAENQYPKDKTAGLYAACYFLNPNIPYYDNQNNALSSPEDIALSLHQNIDYYTNALLNPNDTLFLFFNAHGAGNITQKFSPLFNKSENKRGVLLQMVHTLHIELPWTMTSEEGEERECHTPDEVLSFCEYNVVSDESWEDLVDESFLVWLHHIDPSIEGKIRTHDGHDVNPWCVLYCLNPKVSYDLGIDETADTYIFTAQDIGLYMNDKMEKYIPKQDVNSFESHELDMMCNIDGTRLYYYLKSKGVYDDKIEWIRFCMDVESKDNTEKYAPYTWKIGIYKAIKGLGYNPYYYFPKSDKYVFDLDELEEIPKNEIEEENNNGFLSHWLTIFFQEDPDLDLSQKYAFEEATVEFVEYLATLDIDDIDVKNFNVANGMVRRMNKKVLRKLHFNIWSKIIMGVLVTILTAIAIYALNTIPIDFTSYKGWIQYASLGVLILVWGYRKFRLDDGFFKALLIAFAITVPFFVLFVLTIAYTSYTFSALLLLGFVLTIIFGYLRNRAHKSQYKDVLYPGFEEFSLEPLHYTFKAEDGTLFESSIEDSSITYMDKLKKGTRRVYFLTLILSVFNLATLFMLAYFSPKFEMKGYQNMQKAQQYEKLFGEYTGTFDNRESTLHLYKAKKNQVDGYVNVKYETMLKESIKGSIDMEEKTINLDDVVENGNLDGKYEGVFNEDFSVITGTYQNYKTKKEVKFIFEKKIEKL